MNPSTSLGTTANGGMANPVPSVRKVGNMCCLLVTEGVCRSSVSRQCLDVNYRRRCRAITPNVSPGRKFVVELLKEFQAHRGQFGQLRFEGAYEGVLEFAHPLREDDPIFT